MFYRCNPEKATTCSKRTCFINGGNCALTSNPMFAQDMNKPLTDENTGRDAYYRKKKLEHKEEN